MKFAQIAASACLLGLGIQLAGNVGFAGSPTQASVQVVELKGDAGGKRFDGIGVVNGGEDEQAHLEH
jgi:hypothetical protein